MKEGMAVNLNSHVLLTGGYQDFVGPVDEVDICMDGEHGKQDKQRKKIIFLWGGKMVLPLSLTLIFFRYLSSTSTTRVGIL